MKVLLNKKSVFLAAIVVSMSAILMSNFNTSSQVIPLWELQKEVDRKSLPPYMGRSDHSSPNPASGAHGHAH